MITVPLIDWKDMASLPEDRKDGRQVLLWQEGTAVVARWNPEAIEYGLPSAPHGAWHTGFFSGDLDEDQTIAAPKFWADINPPE